MSRRRLQHKKWKDEIAAELREEVAKLDSHEGRERFIVQLVLGFFDELYAAGLPQIEIATIAISVLTNITVGGCGAKYAADYLRRITSDLDSADKPQVSH